MNPYKRRLRELREVMKVKGIDVYIIPNTDPHLGETIPDHWKIVQWLTGFTGSNATVIVTKSFAGLWTDSRYYIQAGRQLDGSGFVMMTSGGDDASIEDWLQDNIRKSAIIAFDGRLYSSLSFVTLRDTLKIRQPVFATGVDLISGLWENRPPLPDSIAFDHGIEFSGENRGSKIERVRKEMTKMNCDYHLLNSPHDIMWLLNIRGSDVRFSPLLLCRALVSHEQVIIFIDEKKIPLKLSHEFDRLGIVILPYDNINPVLESLRSESTLLLSGEEIPVSLFDSIPPAINLVRDQTIPSGLKAVKNSIEQENLKKVMIRDGVALTRFFIWLEKNVPAGTVTEESAARRLSELRLQQANCTGESFEPVVAFNEHAALPHYSYADNPETVITRDGLLLVDSGGQYLDGTTDLTRTVATGDPGPAEKEDFTLVLKGMIRLASARFPYGTTGSQLDILAREALWEKGYNYGHSTGHGVGFFLNVHEVPPSISPRPRGRHNTPLEPGMVISDEPGIYREGRYGIRIENLVIVEDAGETEFGRFLKFDCLSLCYIDRSLIEKSSLDKKEKDWLNAYNSTVYARLSNFLNEEEREWLKEKTRQI